MALLSRLFSSKKNNKPRYSTSTDKNERSSWKPFTFEKDQVRVLLFRECDWRGRKLLFDSAAVQKVPLENSCKLRFTSRPKTEAKCKKEAYVEVTNGYGYQYTKPSTDAKVLEEMMFGAVAMTFRGTAVKVHSIPTPNRIMFTKVFPSPVVTHTNRRTSDRSLEDSYGSSVNSMSEYFSQNSGSESLLASGPLDVPVGEMAVPKAPGYHSLEGDSGFCGDFSLQSVSSIGSPSYWTPIASPEARNSFGSLCGNKHSGGSLSSLQRRWIRNMSTSLELGLGHTEEMNPCNPQHRRTKLGLAVVITLTEERMGEMEMFLFEHMSIFESMVERLRFTVEKAYLRKETFVHMMHEGMADVQQSLCDLLCSHRLPCPIWLTLTSTEHKNHSSLASMFLQDLCLLITTLDTKATNFFVSTLVTGVLTHHLGWVNTVWPSNIQNSNTSNSSETANSLNDLLKSHPYNPLWAQLSDLYGTLGSPTKIAKTIITTNGRKVDCVNKLLTCMTYFIRCGEVKERINLKQGEDKTISILAEYRVKSDGDKCPKTMILEQFSKSKSKSNEIADDNQINTVTCESQIKNLHPHFRLCSGSFKSTFFDCPDETSDSINRQDLSSCTLLANELDHSQASLSGPLQESSQTSGSIHSETVPDDQASSSFHVSVSSEAIQQASCHLQQVNIPTDLIVQNNIVPPSCFSRSSSSCDTAILYPAVADRATGDVRDLKSSPLTPVHVATPLEPCFSDTGDCSFHVEDSQKHLNMKINISNKEVEQFNEEEQFSAQALRSGNFASPSGAEWEHENYPTGAVCSDRSGVECTDGSTFLEHCQQGRSFSSPCRIEGPSHSSWSVPDGCRSLFSMGDLVNIKNLNSKTHVELSGEHFPIAVPNKQTGGVNSKIVTYEGIGLEDRIESDIHQGSTSGELRSAKGLSRRATHLNNLKDLCVDQTITCNLYPNIEELARMENVHLESEPLCSENLLNSPCGDTKSEDSCESNANILSESIYLKETSEDLPDLITEKVSKLCRVPTTAVLFHLEQSAEENKFKALTEESFEMKVLNSERQMAAHHHSSHPLINVPTGSGSCLDMESMNSESGVLFVLGDNEELKGLNKHTSAVSCCNNNVSNLKKCGSETSVSSWPHFKNESHQKVSGTIVDEPKVVMVKSSSIELETELGIMETDIDDGNSACAQATDNMLNVDVGNVIPRSFSVSLPVLKHKRSKKSTKILRRHTEKYCDRCKTILKLKCDKGGIPLEADCSPQQTFIRCEKCYCYHQSDSSLSRLESSDKGWVQLNRHSSKYVSRSHDQVDLCLRDTCSDGGGEELESSLEPETECMREDNAIFEQYDPSDEEILGPQTQTKEPKIEVPKEIKFSDLQIVELPLPRCEFGESEVTGLAVSLLGGVSTRYIPDLVLQGCSSLPAGWESRLRRDLTLTAKLPLLGHEVTEAVCIVANTHTWEVQLVSSHAYVVDKPGTFGVCVGMSQLVANMLESLVHLWKLKVPAEQCLLHLESKLRELYLRSQALAELLLTTEFCNMELLTSLLNLEANDVPLLLAVASTHSPHIANRYGLSFC